MAALRTIECVIEAAGGVVRRIGDDGSVLVLVVHRRRQDDWSLPKGKLERGEHHLEAALREVAEETGLWCIARHALPEARYRNRKGRSKRVRYWVMEAVGGSFVANREVDRVAWLCVEDAVAVLSYEHEVRLIETFAAVGLATR
jgi:8-oxo-dGTP diphosphatase